MIVVVAASIIAGALLVGAQVEPAGFITMSMGLVLALFFALVILGSPPERGPKMNYSHMHHI